VGRVKRLLLVLGFLTAVAAAKDARSCTCGGPPGVATAFETSDAVFVAKVVRIATIRDTITLDSSAVALFHRLGDHRAFVPNSDPPRLSRMYRRVTLKIARAWKGPRRGTTLFMNTGFGGGDCSFPFWNKKRYLIYATKGPHGQLGTSLCTRSRWYSQATSDIHALDSLRTRGTHS